jgi:hypothetical protein
LLAVQISLILGSMATHADHDYADDGETTEPG